MVRVVGEPGVGKTRLADALVERACSLGLAVGWARSWKGSPPLAVVLELLRAAIGGPDGLLDAEGTDLSALGSLLRGGVAGPGRASMTREAATEALTAVVRGLGPSLLVVDDLHGADLDSLAFLIRLAPRLKNLPTLVVATERSVATGASSEVERHLTDLARLSDGLELDGLNPAAISTLATEAAGHPVDERLAEAIHRATRGNALFVEGVLRAAIREGSFDGGTIRFPRDVQQAIRARAEAAGEEAFHLLCRASVLTRPFSAPLLATMLDLTLARAQSAIERSVDESLLVRVEGERFGFRHGLVADALVATLTPMERASLHARAAAVLHDLEGPTASLSEIAYHRCEAVAAQGHEPALLACRQAAAHASSICAHEEAARLLKRARELVDSEHRFGPRGPSRHRTGAGTPAASGRPPLGRPGGIAGGGGPGRSGWSDSRQWARLPWRWPKPASSAPSTATSSRCWKRVFRRLAPPARWASGSPPGWPRSCGSIRPASSGAIGYPSRRSPPPGGCPIGRSSRSRWTPGFSRSGDPLSSISGLPSPTSSPRWPRRPATWTRLSRPTGAGCWSPWKPATWRRFPRPSRCTRPWPRRSSAPRSTRPSPSAAFSWRWSGGISTRPPSCAARSLERSRQVQNPQAEMGNRFLRSELWLRTGRSADLGPLIVELAADADRLPNLPFIRARTAQIAALAGDLTVARRHLDRYLASIVQNPGEDISTLAGHAFAAEAASQLRAMDACRELHRLLSPYTGIVASIGATICVGSVAHFTGILESALGDLNAAVESLAAALARHGRWPARRWNVKRRIHSLLRSFSATTPVMPSARDPWLGSAPAAAWRLRAGWSRPRLTPRSAARPPAPGSCAGKRSGRPSARTRASRSLPTCCETHAHEHVLDLVGAGELQSRRRPSATGRPSIARPRQPTDGGSSGCGRRKTTRRSGPTPGVRRGPGRSGRRLRTSWRGASVWGSDRASRAVERARVAVAKSVRRALDAIARVEPACAAHLERSLRMGIECAYDPDPAARVNWRW